MRVNDNKTTAEEALKRIPEINATINAASEKTRQAETALGNAAADAKEAKSKAEEAEKIAANVQKVSASGQTGLCECSRSLGNHFHILPSRVRLKPKQTQKRPSTTR